MWSTGGGERPGDADRVDGGLDADPLPDPSPIPDSAPAALLADGYPCIREDIHAGECAP